jgi:5-methylcytosine-specific restriction endonuclease McrA
MADSQQLKRAVWRRWATLTLEGELMAKCCYCNQPLHWSEMTIEHLVRRSDGGTNRAENVRPCCRRCNEAEARRAEFIARLRRGLIA